MLTQDESMQIENFLQQNFSFWNKLKEIILARNNDEISHYDQYFEMIESAVKRNLFNNWAEKHRGKFQEIQDRWRRKKQGENISDVQMNEDIKDILVWIATVQKIDTIWKVASYIPSLFNINIENRGADFSSPAKRTVSRTTAFKFSFLCRFTYNEAKSLLTEGAFEDDFNPRRMDEMLYMFALHHKLYYPDVESLLFDAQVAYLENIFGEREKGYYQEFVKAMENIFPLLFRISGRSDKGKPLSNLMDSASLDKIAVSIAVFDKMGQNIANEAQYKKECKTVDSSLYKGARTDKWIQEARKLYQYAMAKIYEMSERCPDDYKECLTSSILSQFQDSVQSESSDYIQQLIHDFHFYQEAPAPWISKSRVEAYQEKIRLLAKVIYESKHQISGNFLLRNLTPIGVPLKIVRSVLCEINPQFAPEVFICVEDMEKIAKVPLIDSRYFTPERIPDSESVKIYRNDFLKLQFLTIAFDGFYGDDSETATEDFCAESDELEKLNFHAFSKFDPTDQLLELCVKQEKPLAFLLDAVEQYPQLMEFLK